MKYPSNHPSVRPVATYDGDDGSGLSWSIQQSKRYALSFREPPILKVWVDPDKGGRMPRRAKDGDAGVDIFAAESAYVLPKTPTWIETGIRVAIPAGWYWWITDRSGNSKKFKVLAGIVDSGFRNYVKILVVSLLPEQFVIERGDRPAQGILCPFVGDAIQVDDPAELGETERGQDGWGSTGA